MCARWGRADNSHIFFIESETVERRDFGLLISRGFFTAASAGALVGIVILGCQQRRRHPRRTLARVTRVERSLDGRARARVHRLVVGAVEAVLLVGVEGAHGAVVGLHILADQLLAILLLLEWSSHTVCTGSGRLLRGCCRRALGLSGWERAGGDGGVAGGIGKIIAGKIIVRR